MDINILSTDECNTKENNLELFSIIWLDSNLPKGDEKLCNITNHLKKFQDIEECQQYIEQTSQQNRLILIVNEIQGQQIVPHIHHLQQIFSIYVYCMNKYTNQQWASNFYKVKGVVNDFDELIIRIKEDEKIRNRIQEPLSIRIFNVNDKEDKSTTGLNGKFVYSQLLLDCILRIKPNDKDKHELISLCTQKYIENSIELENIYEFSMNYSSDKALYWYTRESFFYKTLNKALRTQNIHIIYLFRSYINDICLQLQEKQSNKQLIVYRCQLISKDELNYLSVNIGQFISINSFFSTSIQRDVASFYMGNGIPQDNLQRVLFEIDANPNLNKTKFFANISLQSDFYNEFEVLFTLGSIFRLNNITVDNNQLWTIQLTLCSDDEHHLKPIFSQMKAQNGFGETNLLILAKFLWKMGKFDLTEEYYDRFIKQIPSDDPSLITLYEDLEYIASQKGDFDKSLQWQKKILSLKQSTASVITVNSLSPSATPVIKQYKNYPTGDVYDGETLNDLYHGYGVYTWKNGDLYEGMWENNHREGRGIWTWGEQTPSAGDRYSGQWHLDKKHGYGEYFQANGDTYMGQFENDQRHGSGIYRMKNGQCFNVVYNHGDFMSSEEIKK